MPTTPMTAYSGSNVTSLVNAILGANSGISVDASSITLKASGNDAVNFYDGSLSQLGIGSGLLITSGTTPGTSNTVGWFGQDNTQYDALGNPLNYNNGDPEIDAVVNSVFQTQSYDATALSFNFSVTDPAATSVSFDLVFGSDEYPEWVDAFVDCAVIIVNGVNYALFNHDPKAPLSVISPNLAAGYFQDNAGNVLPIEYDGVSHVLKIVAPINPGQVNSIKIAVADTGDHIYDSGMFISNMVAGNTPGSGVVITPVTPSTNGDDIVTGSVADELINLLAGNDTAYAGGGDDIVVAGAGNDTVYGGSGNDVMEGDQGNDLLDGGAGTSNEAVFLGKSTDYAISYDAATGHYTVTDLTSGASEGTDTLANVQLAKFSDGLFDLTPSGLVAHVSGGGVPVNTAGSVVLSGAAVVGHALTAIVIDADGVPSASGAVSITWQTSADGVNWIDTGVTGQSYTLTGADSGQQIKAGASYVDVLGHAEAPISAPLTVAAASGNIVINPMQLSAPGGASIADPLTTLVNNAIGLGFTANEAVTAVKAALGLPDIDLKSYDALSILASNPTDATALAVIKISAEVAMTAAVSDPSGFDLTLKVMDAASNGQVLNLADPATLATILSGIDANLLDIVTGLNKDMADAGSFATVNLVWNDYAGQADNLAPYIGHIDALAVHINLAPTGASTASLPFGSEGADYVIQSADLLAGFTDPEGAALSVVALSANGGGTITDNGDGSFTFTPDAGFNGPVELAFTVSDPEGATVNGSNLLVIEAAPVAIDITPPTATITSDHAGTTATGDVSYTVTFSEDVFGLGTDSFFASFGTVTSISGSGGVYTVVVTPDAGFEGTMDLSLTAGVTFDAAGNPNDAAYADPQAVDTLAPGVTITSGVAGTATGDISYTVSFSEAVSGLAADDFTVTNGTVSLVTGSGNTYTVVVTPTAGFEGTVDFALKAGAVSDGAGNLGTAAAAAAQAVDTLAPTVAAFSPADGASGVAVGANIVVSFSETVALGAGTIQIHQGAANGALVESFDVAGSSRLALNGSTLTIDPTANLAAGVQYFVTFTAGSLHDSAGNGFAGTASYDFTTLAPPPPSSLPLNLIGTAGADTLTGGALDDTLTGLGGVDSLDGQDGSDTYVIGASSQHSAAEFHDSGTSGIDTVVFNGAKDSTLKLFAGDTGIEVVQAGSGSMSLHINASAVQNGLTLIGNAGNNFLTGTAFDDVLIGGAGSDTLIGGAGNDTASYATATTGVTVSLSQSSEQNTGGAGKDILQGIENLIGGSGNDSLSGNDLANRLDGGQGNDLLDGRNGNDTLLGGAGADTLTGGLGVDLLWGGTGADTFAFNTLKDSLTTARDSIWDFNHAEGDRIDLHLIDAITGGKDQAFTFAGSAFGHVAGQLISVLEGDHYAVQGDVNGDGVADFAINVYAAAPLVSADFIL